MRKLAEHLNLSPWMLVVALTSVMALSACNTLEGFGDDVEAAGDEVEEATE